MEDQHLWKRFLFTLRDEVFFSVIHNYLGPVQTPYNKHDLVEKLCLFIQRDDIQQAMLDRLSVEEMEILSAVEVLKDGTVERLCTFFEPGFLAGWVYSKLLNLSDRLLLFKPQEQHSLMLNPYLREGLVNRGLGLVSLIRASGEQGHDTRGVRPWFNDGLVLATLALLREWREVTRADGSLKKVVISRFMKAITGINNWNAERIRYFTASLSILGLVGYKGSDCIISLSQWKEWGCLSQLQRLVYQWAAYLIVVNDKQLVLEDFSVDTVAHASKRLRKTAEFLHIILQRMNTALLYSPASLGRIIGLELGSLALSTESIIRGMKELELILVHEADTLILNQGLFSLMAEDEPSATALSVHSNYHLTLHSRGSFMPRVMIALAARLEHYDNICRFEMSRDTVFAGLAAGLEGGELLQQMALLSKDLSQNVRVSIESWEGEYFSVNIRPGYVISVGEKDALLIKYFMDELPAVEELGNGHFLFPPDNLEWVNVLERVGVSIRSAFNILFHGDDLSLSPITPFKEKSVSALEGGAEYMLPADGGGREKTQRQCEDLERQVEERGLAADLEQDIKRRIQNGLILIPEQIDTGIFRSDISEAHGLDYNAKLRLIEVAIGAESLLESSITGSPDITLLRPIKVIKKPGQDLLQAIQLPGERSLEVQISKIRQIRRLKASLFNRL